MTKEIITVKNLNLAFGKKRVLAGVDLDFARGETVVIAGNNGAGKSTFLRCLAGVLLADSGEIRFQEDTPKEKIAFISDKMSLFEDFTLAQGIDFHRRVFGSAAFDHSLLDELNLERRQRIRDLSVGERAIFHLSLLFSQKPEVLLLDEIIHTIDPYLRELFLDGLIDMIDEFKTTVIMVNHTFSEMGRIPERVLIMEAGRFIFDERSEDLPKRIKKIVKETAKGETGEIEKDLPVIYINRSSLYWEYIVYPFSEELAARTDHEFQDVALAEIVKSFIGGYYAKKRV